ncbi:MAG TPA: hypothetical protein VNA88_03205 [Candidatus Kapabacteria bacterium]|jgi:hypothetical protein|nr:hypothetical protein [Candidatus Kapabacteria bacterium]
MDLMFWILVPLIVIAVVLTVYQSISVFARKRRKTDDYWEQVERSGEMDPELVAAAVGHELAPMDLDAALDALSQLDRLEREARERLEAERADATFVDSQGNHYSVSEEEIEAAQIDADAVDDEPADYEVVDGDDTFMSIESRYDVIFEELEAQREEIDGRLAHYFHLRRLRADELRERDPIAAAAELEEIVRMEQRYRRFDGEAEA